MIDSFCALMGDELAAPGAAAVATHARSISEYTLLEFLGEGSTAHVYLAEPRAALAALAADTSATVAGNGVPRTSALPPRVAIKVIDKLLVRHARLENKIRQEMVLHAQLQHPNVLRVHEAFEDARNYYMVLEFCEQRSVAALVKTLPNRRVDEATAKRLFFEMVSGVAYLHAQGVLHRDLKLANLLLTHDGHVKISDFGLATRTSGDNMTICGTPNFIAPEVLANDAAYSEAVDMWSLGCILFCLLLGRAPFEGRRVSETLANVANASNQELVFADGFSASAGDLIKRLLTSDPTRRPSAEQVLLHPWLRELQRCASVASTAAPRVTQIHERQLSRPIRDHRVGSEPHQPAAAAAQRAVRPKPRASRRAEMLSASRSSKLSASRVARRHRVVVSSDSDSDMSDVSSSSSSASLSSLSRSGGVDDADGYDNDGDDESFAVTRTQSQPTASRGDASDAHSAVSATTESADWRQRTRNSASVVSVVLHLDLQDVPALGISAHVSESVSWTCAERSDAGHVPTFTLEISNGLAVEYAPARGVLSGKAADGTALRYDFVGRTQSSGAHAAAKTVDAALRVLVRLCQCLALRTVQLRKRALQLESAKLPMVHFDSLPASLLASLRHPDLGAALHRSLRVAASESPTADTAAATELQHTVEIVGVGRGHLARSGDLRIVFLDGSQLSLDADGSHLRFQAAAHSSRVDVFSLLPTSSSNNTSAFLPTVVKKRLESVPDFIRRLRDPTMTTSQR